MDILKRQRGAVKAILTNFSKYLNDNLKDDTNIPRHSILELETRLSGIEVNLLQKFVEIQDKIDLACDSAELEREYLERSEFEDRYYFIIALAKRHLYDNKGDSDSSGSNKSSCKSVINPVPSVKLPDINLPTFDGSLQNWLEFRDVFESLIHKNESLSDIQRFHYLRASMCNEPAQLISSRVFF